MILHIYQKFIDFVHKIFIHALVVGKIGNPVGSFLRRVLIRRRSGGGVRSFSRAVWGFLEAFRGFL